MSVRRGLVRLAVPGLLLTGAVLAGATPAAADDDSVRVRAASSFTAGGSAGGVNLTVRKGSDGCFGVRTALAVRLDGLAPDQVQIQVASAGAWQPLAVSSLGDGVVGTDRFAPDKPTLCKDKSLAVRYRLAFLPGAPAGRATIIGEAFTGSGQPVDRGSDTSRVNGSRATATPTPRPTLSAEPTEAVEPVESVEPAEVTTAQPAVVPAGKQQGESGGSFGMGTVAMLFGVGMVGVGAALIVLLLRRNRAERSASGSAPAAPPGGYPAAPRVYGGASAGGYPATPRTYGAGPAAPSGYGAGPAAPSTYGAAGPAGGHRATPTTYGAGPAAPSTYGAGPAGGHTATPTTYGAGAAGGPPSDRTAILPSVPPQPSGHAGGAPGDGEATRLIPRIPPTPPGHPPTAR